MEMGLVADPVVHLMSKPQLEKAIIAAKKKMLQAAKDMDFLEAARLRDEMFRMQQELENKYKEYVSKRDSLSEIVRVAKETDIQDLQQRIQNFNQVATQQLQQKQNEMLRPIFEKAQKAVADVAKEKGLIYVFDVSGELGTVLYKSNESLDVLPLAKTKLGIK